ncbi:MAG: hypothetical protein HZR80_03555 [Candidatus Heimdallarchaeota archaeon]
MTLITMTDTLYESFYLESCPRKKELFQKCLFMEWRDVIEEFSTFKNSNKFITGREGNRKIDITFLNDELLKLESQIFERLLETEKGMNFLEIKKRIPQMMLTFCCLGCQLPLRDYRHGKYGKSKNKPRLLNETLYWYYLHNQEVTNAGLQRFEAQIPKREKRMEENLKLQTQQSPNADFDIHDIIVNSLKNKEKIDDKEIVAEISDTGSLVKSPLTMARDKLRGLSLFDIDKFFLIGDQEMTDFLLKICTNCEKKRCITCDESHNFYWLAARKLIHLFLYQTDLFNEIPLTADCLVKEQIDITKLRRRFELQLRQTVSWELTKDEKDKFVLCTLCHLIRHFRLLGQIDLLDGIQTFFKFRGKIYNLSESKIATEQAEILKLLQLTKPQVIGDELQKVVEVKQLPQEEKTIHFTLPKSQRIEDLKRVFITLVKSIDYESLLPITILTLRSRAKELINPEKEELSEVEDYAWVDVLKRHWQDEALRPFLAEQALLRMGKKEEIKQSPITSEKLTFDLVRMSQTEKEFFQQVKQECVNCSNDVLACGEILEQVKKTLKSGKKAIRELWKNNELLRPCIAKILLE